MIKTNDQKGSKTPEMQQRPSIVKETNLSGKGSSNHIRSGTRKEHEHIAQIIAHNGPVSPNSQSN